MIGVLLIGPLITLIGWLLVSDTSTWKAREVAALAVFWPLVWIYALGWMIAYLFHGLWLLFCRVS